jgi:hypothetical protein
MGGRTMMIKAWSIMFTMILAVISVSGCTASLKAYPERSYDPEGELKAMALYLSQDAITKYTATDNLARNGMTRRQWRDAVINARIRAIDLHFGFFQQALFQQGVGSSIATDWTTLGLGGAGAVFAGSAQVLSAISAVVVGGKSSFDKNAYFDKSMPALLTAMVAGRKQVLVRIREGLTKDIDQYPMELALNDLDSYYNVGSIPGALMEVSESAGKLSQEADKRLKQILVVSPVPEGLQKRREAAAAFVKGLDAPKLATLAKALGKD